MGICSDSVRAILRTRKIETKSSPEVLREQYGKMVSMYSLQDEYVRTFPSLHDTATYMVENNLTGCKNSTIRTHISEVCRGKKKDRGKFKWKFE